MKPKVNDILANAQKLTVDVSQKLLEPELFQSELRSLAEKLENISKMVKVAELMEFEL